MDAINYLTEEEQAIAEMYASQYDHLYELSEDDVDAIAESYTEGRIFNREYPINFHE